MTCRQRCLAIGLVMLVIGASRAAPTRVNLNGIFSFQGIPDTCTATVTQDGVSLTLFVDCVFGDFGATGIIDPMTGAFTASGGCVVGPLVGNSTIVGTAALDSSGFAGTITCPPALPGTHNYLAPRTCPNGTVSGGEECDDGNLIDDDGCSNFCHSQPVTCDDDDPCTRDVIDPIDGCLHAESPQNGCRTAGKTQFQLKRVGTDKKRLTWKWVKGATTTQEEFGIPTGTDAFTLCVYAGAAQATALRVDIPPDTDKWQAVSDKGWKYKDPAASADGVHKVLLKGGADGKAKIVLKGRGTAVPDAAPGMLPVPSNGFPVTAQLFNTSSNQCWTSRFEETDVTANQADAFKAKAQMP